MSGGPPLPLPPVGLSPRSMQSDESDPESKRARQGASQSTDPGAAGRFQAIGKSFVDVYLGLTRSDKEVEQIVNIMQSVIR